MTHAALGELGIQPLCSAFSQGYEVRPRHAASQPSVTHHVMKYKLADGGGETRKGVNTSTRLFPSIPLVLQQLFSHTLGLSFRECTVLFTCHVSLRWVREGLEHLEFSAVVLQRLVFEERRTLTLVPFASSRKTLTHFCHYGPKRCARLFLSTP